MGAEIGIRRVIKGSTGAPAYGMTVGERREAVLAALRAGTPAKQVSLMYHVSIKHVYQMEGKAEPKDGDRLCAPARAHDLVAWRHHFIMEMDAAGYGPSFIGAVLRLDHTSVIHHTRGQCRCIPTKLVPDGVEKPLAPTG